MKFKIEVTDRWDKTVTYTTKAKTIDEAIEKIEANYHERSKPLTIKSQENNNEQ